MKSVKSDIYDGAPLTTRRNVRGRLAHRMQHGAARWRAGRHGPEFSRIEAKTYCGQLIKVGSWREVEAVRCAACDRGYERTQAWFHRVVGF